MRFNIYGRFHVDVRRENASWVVYRADAGKRTLLHDIVVPSDVAPDEVGIHLDDIFHELAGIGQSVELVPTDRCTQK